MPRYLRHFAAAGLSVFAAAVAFPHGAQASVAWTPQTFPTPTSASVSSSQINTVDINGVSCPRSNDCYAVGAFGSFRGPHPSFIEHYDGTGWTQVSAPSLTGNGVLQDISCANATSCVAIGSSQAEVLANGRWRLTRTGVATLNSISCASARMCMAVGQNALRSAAVVLRWTGAKWISQKLPKPARYNSYLLSTVSCVSATVCYAAGPSGDREGGSSGEVLRWAGGRWQKTVQPGDYTIDTLACLSASRCMATGAPTFRSKRLDSGFVELTNGRWRVAAGTHDLKTGPLSISCSSQGHCAAVGTRPGGSNPSEPDSRPYAASWNGHAWATDRTINPAATSGWNLTSVSCAAHSSACESVGYFQAAPQFPISGPDVQPFAQGLS